MSLIFCSLRSADPTAVWLMLDIVSQQSMGYLAACRSTRQHVHTVSACSHMIARAEPRAAAISSAACDLMSRRIQHCSDVTCPAACLSAMPAAPLLANGSSQLYLVCRRARS